MMDHGAEIMAHAFRRALLQSSQTAAPTPAPETQQASVSPVGIALAGVAVVAMCAATYFLNSYLAKRWTDVYDAEEKSWPDFVNPGTADASKGEVAIMSMGTHRYLNDPLDEKAKPEDPTSAPKIIGRLCVVKAADVTAAVGPWNSDKTASAKYDWPKGMELMGMVTPCTDQKTRDQRPNNIAQMFDKKHEQVNEAAGKDLGGIFRVRNKRTNREDSVWIIPVQDEFAKHGDCIVSCHQTNPHRRPGEVGDWMEGDVMQFVHYPQGPDSFGKRCALSGVTRISGNEIGWNKKPSAAKLGFSHVVAGHYNDLELEFEFAQPATPTHMIFGAFYQPNPFKVSVDYGTGFTDLEPPEGYSQEGRWLQKHGSVAMPLTAANPIKKVRIQFDKLGDPFAVEFCTNPDPSLL